MAEGTVKLTPTEERMLALLAKGRPVRRDELKAVTDDGDLCSNQNVTCHVSNLRRKISQQDGSVSIMAVCESTGWTYRMVRLMSSPYDGVK